MLRWCWASVEDGGPALTQHWISVLHASQGSWCISGNANIAEKYAMFRHQTPSLSAIQQRRAIVSMLCQYWARVCDVGTALVRDFTPVWFDYGAILAGISENEYHVHVLSTTAHLQDGDQMRSGYRLPPSPPSPQCDDLPQLPLPMQSAWATVPHAAKPLCRTEQLSPAKTRNVKISFQWLNEISDVHPTI